MVEFFPDLEFIRNDMRPKPYPGESFLLNWLNDYLSKADGEYEVYYQGKLNGSLPDFVIIRKNCGALIIEVKDWELSKYVIKDKKTWTCLYPRGGKRDTVDVSSPLKQARYYKKLFFNTYSVTLARGRIRGERNYSSVDSAIFFYKSNAAEVKRFFGSRYLQMRNGSLPTSDYIILFTPDLLQSQGFRNIFAAKYFWQGTKSQFFNDDVYNEITRNLRPSKHSVFKRLPKNLNREQANLIKSVPNKKQKVRGPAGCGKTLVLAHRAVNAYNRTKARVVILTFNITLCNYIKDTISAILGDIPDKGRVMQNFQITNYHSFVYQYRAKNNQLDQIEVNPRTGKNFDTLLLERIDQQFLTILVDEVQDYEHSWIDTIHKLVAPNGELVFFGDEEQNLYGKELVEDDGKQKRIYTGVPGRWNNLKETYRLSGKISDLARAFQLEFFSDYEDNVIKPAVQQTLDFANTTIDYYYVGSFNASQVVKVFLETVIKYGIHNDDVCILSQVKEHIRSVDKALRDLPKRNLKTITTFASVEDLAAVEKKYPIPPDADELEVQKVKAKRQEEIDDLEHTLKSFFYMESGKVKLSTIHSYKGWSADTEILILSNRGIPHAGEPTFLNDEMVYTSITRAVNHLVIINVDNGTYNKFFRAQSGIVELK